MQMSLASGQMLVRHETFTRMPAEIIWHLESAASLTLIHELHLTDKHPHHVQVQFFLEPKSSLTYVPILVGGQSLTLTLEVTLESYAQATVAGIYLMQHEQQYTLISKQHHRGPGATSNLRLNGIVADAAFLHYSGIIIVDESALKTQASQENKTIVWGKKARAISIPALEVHTHEVQCAHGSAMSSFEPEHLWYLQSRGLSTAGAQQLLLASFFEQTLADALSCKQRAPLIESLLERGISHKE